MVLRYPSADTRTSTCRTEGPVRADRPSRGSFRRALLARIRLRPLGPRDLQQISTLEAVVFPALHCYGSTKHREMMSVPQIKGRNFSAGAFDRGTLVGYVLMYCRASMFLPDQQVIYVQQLAVLPRYRRYVSRMLIDCVIRAAVMYGYAVEARCREHTAYTMLKRSDTYIARYGGRRRLAVVERISGGERIFAVRYEAVRSLGAGFTGLAYKSYTRFNRCCRMFLALPLRMLRRACLLVPRQHVPRQLRRLTYLE